MFNKIMFFIYYFINPIWSRTKDDDDIILSRDDLIRIHGEGFQQGEINNDVIEINSISLRDLYEEYLEVRDRNTGMIEWASRAGLVSRELNLEFSVLGLIMVDHFAGISIPMDESIIQISMQDLFFTIGKITRLHSQHYIIMQLVYRGRRIAESERMGIINSEEARHSRVDWKMNVIMILSFYGLTGDTFNFLFERLEHLIML